MSDKIESTIRDVVMKGITTKQVGQDNKTIWEIETAGPKVTTFLAGLGNKAQALYEQGTVVDMVVSIVQNGKYTNYYLEKIQPSQNQAKADQVQQSLEKARATQEVTFEQFSAGEREKQVSIHRQVAAKVAGAISTEVADFWANVDAIFHYFQTGKNPWANAETPQAVGVSSHTPVGAFDDAEPPSEEDDIPF